MDIPLKQIKNLLKTLEEGGASEFEYEDEKIRVRVSLARAAAPAAAPGAAAAVAPAAAPLAVREAGAVKDEAGDPHVVFVTSPFVGTFYR